MEFVSSGYVSAFAKTKALCKRYKTAATARRALIYVGKKTMLYKSSLTALPRLRILVEFMGFAGHTLASVGSIAQDTGYFYGGTSGGQSQSHLY
jgi:hypothetical protein